MTTPQDPFGPPGDRPAAGGSQPAGQGWEPPADQPTGGQYGGPPPSGQAWGSAPDGPGQAGPKRNGLGVAALIVGIIALIGSFTVVGGVVLGIAAIVLGVLGRGRVKKGEADNGGMAIAGIVLGAIALVLSAIVLAAGAAFFFSDSGQGLFDCLEQAGTDQAAVDACETEFAEELGQ